MLADRDDAAASQPLFARPRHRQPPGAQQMIYPGQVRVGEIRDAVSAHVRSNHPDPVDTLIRYELGLCLGETRVDVAVVNGRLSGWEIKSGQDNLARLPRQVALYGRVLDEAVIVATCKHLKHVVDYVPTWWGLAEVAPDDSGRPVISYVRQPQDSPGQEPFAVAQLLWRDEAYEILAARSLADGLRRATRWKLWEVLVEQLTLTELRSEVRAYLRARPAR